MRKHRLFILIFVALATNGCQYLDIAPEMGLDDNEVFTNLKNYKAYLDNVYDGNTTGKMRNLLFSSFPMRMDSSESRFTYYCLTDIADCGRTGYSQTIKGGNLGEIASKFTTGDRFPIFAGMYSVIRVVNKCIQNIDMLKDATENDKNDILGQSYFIRAWAHYTVCNYFGGIPYLTHSLEGDDDWDYARLSAYDTYCRCAEDCQTAFDYFKAAGKVRRDPLPGQEGNLSHSEMKYPNGVAAKALRGRCLLYAASPLNNPSNDREAWENAANANAEALSLALEYGYYLLPFSDWKTNCWGVRYTNEHIWAWSFEAAKLNDNPLKNANGYPFINNSLAGGTCPTQQAVDMFETKWGDPLYTEADRDYAYSLTGEGSIGPDGEQHHYYEQNPYVNRDPRFDMIIIHDGSVTAGASQINIYYDPVSGKWPTTLLNGMVRSAGVPWNSDSSHGNTNTGYYLGKYWDGNYPGDVKYYQTDPLIRLAELYLNYAEAVNEISGPAGKVGNLPTALEAVNIIRSRAGMPDVQQRFTGSADSFRDRLRNERTIELMYEGHHYYKDERRWKVVPDRMKGPLMGIYVESVETSNTYPAGRRYTRTPIPANRQSTWKDAMYYLYLEKDQANKLKNYVNNEIW